MRFTGSTFCLVLCGICYWINFSFRVVEYAKVPLDKYAEIAEVLSRPYQISGCVKVQLV